MKNIRAGRGLGDSIYLQSIVRHLTQGGKSLRVASDFPEVFSTLGNLAHVYPFTRAGIDLTAHYITRKSFKNTTQFQDMCLSARVYGDVQMRLEWPVQKGEFADQIRAAGKPIVCVQLPRAPMGRSDGFGAELLPDCKAVQRAIDRIRERATVVQIGAGEPLYKFSGIDFDFANQTTVKRLLEICSMADAFIGYPSFIIPMAESFDKPALIFWARASLNSQTQFIAQITPQKLLHKATCRATVDDATPEEIHDAVELLLQKTPAL